MQEIIVVEGKNDLALLKKINPNFNVYTTNGSAVLEHLDTLKSLSKNNKLILLLDPDNQGERIRKIIDQNIPNCSHIFVPKKYCICNKKHKVGIEHMDINILKEYLKNILVYKDNKINLNDLFDLKLSGYNDSKKRRLYLDEKLNIGITNTKTLLARLKLFNYNKEDLKKILEEGGFY